MRKKLETLPLSELRAIAKENHLKNISTLRKAELIDRLCALHEELEAEKRAKESREQESRPQENKLQENASENASESHQETEPEMKSGKPRGRMPEKASERPERTFAQPADGEVRRPREYRPRNTEFAQRASGNVRRQMPQQRTGSGRPQRSYDYGQKPERRTYSRPQPARSGDAGNPAEGQAQQPGGLTAENDTRRTETAQTWRPEAAELRREPETEKVIRNPETASVHEQPAEVVSEAPAAKTSGEMGTGLELEGREDLQALDSGIVARGILEVMPDGFGFIRSANYLPGDEDVYVAPSQIRRFNLKTGDVITGIRRIKTSAEKFAALLYLTQVNGCPPAMLENRPNFEDLTPIFPNVRLHLERPGGTKAMRIVDLLSPVGKGQRGMIVSPPKAGKTTLLKDIAKAITVNHPDMHLIILLIDERPEEVTDIKESIEGNNVEVIYSTFDELPDHHKRVSEMVLERAKRLVEHGRDVMILLDSITRLARAYNLTVAPSGRTLSGGLDPAALYMPKRFFGAARNMREGGSLTILATALVDTGSRMDDMVFEEFKGTGNMEVVLNRKLSEKRIFPAIDIMKSGTRRDDLLLTPEEIAAADLVHKITNESRGDEAVERVLNLFSQTRTNREFIAMAGKLKFGNQI